MPTKRKASDLVSSDSPDSPDSPSPQHPSKRTKGEPSSTLVPEGERRKAKVGEKDTSLLRMVCIETRSGEKKELHFKKLIHSEIDWNNNDHISKINAWRNQLYGRAGMKSKWITMWHEHEVSFLELTFHLLIAEGAKFGIMAPRNRTILDDFNKYFTGMVFKDSNGEEFEPREARKANAFTSKLTRVTGKLKERLEALLANRVGDCFSPTITKDMIEEYIKLKAQSPVKGDSKNFDQVFTWKTSTPAPTGNAYIGNWQKALESMLKKDPRSKMFENGSVDLEIEANNSMTEDASSEPALPRSEDVDSLLELPSSDSIRAAELEAAAILVQMRNGADGNYNNTRHNSEETLPSSP